MGQLVVGIDMGGTADNVTVLEDHDRFVIDHLVESPSRVGEGPAVAIEALAEAFEHALDAAGVGRATIGAVGLGTPGPASSVGVLSSLGATNFSEPPWWGFDLRGALEARLQLPVIYSNDANAAALYAHYAQFGAEVATRSSVSAIVGTGLGGGVVVGGSLVLGASGMAGELGHLRIPLDGVLREGQTLPRCNCGRVGDVESVASLTGIIKNLLPYWLSRFPDHELATLAVADAAKKLRGYAELGDAMALQVFEQQARALGRLFSLIADVLDPDAYFVGGGVVEAAPQFREWYVQRVADAMEVREEQSRVVAVVADGDMAGARGAALAARQTLV